MHPKVSSRVLAGYDSDCERLHSGHVRHWLNPLFGQCGVRPPQPTFAHLCAFSFAATVDACGQGENQYAAKTLERSPRSVITVTLRELGMLALYTRSCSLRFGKATDRRRQAQLPARSRGLDECRSGA